MRVLATLLPWRLPFGHHHLQNQEKPKRFQGLLSQTELDLRFPWQILVVIEYEFLSCWNSIRDNFICNHWTVSFTVGYFWFNLLPMEQEIMRKRIVVSDEHCCAGSPSGNSLTPVGPCRYDSSLGNWDIPELIYHYVRPPFCQTHVLASDKI